MADVDDLTAKIEATMVANYGGEDNISDDPTSGIRARIYARATEIAFCQLGSVAAGNQYIPSQATDLLGKLEWEYKLFPRAGDDIPTRQAAVTAAAKLAGGPTRANITAILAALLGADFVAYLTLDKSASIEPFLPAVSGNWPLPGTLAVFGQLTDRVLSGAQTVGFAKLAGRAEPLAIGESILLDPGYTRPERVMLTGVTESTFSAVFTRAHPKGAAFTSGRAPNASSTKGTALIVLTVAAARDAEVRRRVNLIMSRVLRATSRWSIVEETSGQAGPFAIAESLLGCASVGSIAVIEPGDTTVSIAAAASSSPPITAGVRSPSRSVLSASPPISVTAASRRTTGAVASSAPTISVTATGGTAPHAIAAPTISITATAAAKTAAAPSSAPTISATATGAHTP